MGGFLGQVFSNDIVLSVIFAYTLASIIKIFFYWLGTNKWNLMVFFKTGGMPSSHTATIVAMASSVYFLEGPSNLFMVCLIVSSIIIADAIGLRRSVGKQAQIINKVTDEFKHFKKFKTKRLYELVGHTPKQAIAGLVLGVFVAWFFSII
jgi:uncharacterized protein